MPRPTRVNLSPEVIRYTRAAMQMTQLEFGEYLGVEPNTVYRWEAGIHLPVGRKRREIERRYRAAQRNEDRQKGGSHDAASDATILPADAATDAVHPVDEAPICPDCYGVGYLIVNRLGDEDICERCKGTGRLANEAHRD